MKKKRGHKATDEEKQWIRYSLDRADLTYVNPGRKDHVDIGKKDGERQYCPKRYLLWNLRDLLNILNENEVAGFTAGVETFIDRFEKPLPFLLLYTFIRNHKQLVYNQNIPQGSCLREMCENSCLLAKGISKCVKGVNLPANPHEIVKENCCNSSNDDCILVSCVQCSSPNIFNGNDEDISSNDSDNTDSSGREAEGDQVIYSKWSWIEKKVQKIIATEDHSDYVRSWKENVKSLKQHIF